MILTIQTDKQTQFVEVTSQVRKTIKASGVPEGLCMLFVPHTTAGITINENADPSVRSDVLMVLNKVIPWEDGYRHREGNSPAHIKASLMGASELVAVENGEPVLGTWQGIFFCEFDGPRTRKLHLRMLPA